MSGVLVSLSTGLIRPLPQFPLRWYGRLFGQVIGNCILILYLISTLNGQRKKIETDIVRTLFAYKSRFYYTIDVSHKFEGHDACFAPSTKATHAAPLSLRFLTFTPYFLCPALSSFMASDVFLLTWRYLAILAKSLS